jgi:hypothetical protein
LGSAPQRWPLAKAAGAPCCKQGDAAGVRLKFRDRYQDIEDRSISAAPVGFGSSHMCARTPVPLFRNFHVRGIAPTLNS